MKTIVILLALVVCTQAGFSWEKHSNKLSNQWSEKFMRWKKPGSESTKQGIWGQHKEWFQKMKKHLGQITEGGRKAATEIWGNYFRAVLEPTTYLELSPTSTYQPEQTTNEVQAMGENGKPTFTSEWKWSKVSGKMFAKRKHKRQKMWAKKKWEQRKDKKFWTKTSGEERRPSKMGGKPNRSKGMWAKNWFPKMWGKWGQKRNEQKQDRQPWGKGSQNG